MTGSKATKDKAKMVLNQILDAAVEDGLIAKSPLRSKRIKITGRASKASSVFALIQCLIPLIVTVRVILAISCSPS